MWRVTRKTEMKEQKRFKHISTRPVPYTTKTGIQIGRFYEPPRQSLTAEGEFMQAVLLKDRRAAFPNLEKLGLGLYMAAMICLFTLIAVVVNK